MPPSRPLIHLHPLWVPSTSQPPCSFAALLGLEGPSPFTWSVPRSQHGSVAYVFVCLLVYMLLCWTWPSPWRPSSPEGTGMRGSTARDILGSVTWDASQSVGGGRQEGIREGGGFRHSTGGASLDWGHGMRTVPPHGLQGLWMRSSCHVPTFSTEQPPNDLWAASQRANDSQRGPVGRHHPFQ